MRAVVNYENASVVVRELQELQRKSAGLPSSRRIHLNSPCKKIKKFLVVWRFGGLPMTFFYGIFIYSYLTYMVLPNVDTDRIKETEIKEKPQTSFCFSQEILDLFPNNTSPRKVINAESGVFEETSSKNHLIGLYTSCAFTLIIGTASIFSTHTRCIMMLIMPGIVTGRGRGFLLTMAVGLLIEGPVNSINYNINQIIQSTVCMYKSMKNIACHFSDQIQRFMKYKASMVKEFQEKMTEDMKRIQEEVKQASNAVKKDLERRKRELQERINKATKDLKNIKNIFKSIASPCSAVESGYKKVEGFFEGIGDFFGKRRRRSVKICGSVIPFPDINIGNMDLGSLNQLNKWVKDLVPGFKVKLGDVPDIEKLLDAPSVADVRGKILNTVNNLFNKVVYLKYAKKFFLLCSLIFLTLSSVRYLLNYYSDDSFDNKFIDDNIRKLWKQEDYEKLTPLRRWELIEKYQASASVKLSKKELKGILIKAFPTIILTVITLSLMIGDYGLRELLKTMLANGKFAISFAGMEEGFSAKAMFNAFNKDSKWNMKPLNLKKLDLSTDACLPRALITNKMKTIILGVLLFTMLLSTIFDAYAMRLRANICNMFYKKRAKERAVSLHEVILYGRQTRQLLLRKIILNELHRRKRRNKFSWILQVIQACLKFKRKKEVSCPGCFQKTKIEDTTKLTVTDRKIKIECQLCNDCYKDY